VFVVCGNRDVVLELKQVLILYFHCISCEVV
jgi:hypothetical protein